jgi:putative transposase
LSWTGLKKNLASSVPGKLALIDKNTGGISIRRQAELLGISRSTVYYRPIANPKAVLVTRLIDEIYTESPFYGSRKIQEELKRKGYPVGRERVQKLMREMGIEAIYPKRKMSQPHPAHKIYPYLLRGLRIERVNQVWSTDITYIRLQKGWGYLVAIMDWFSRYVLAWNLSTTMEADFCVYALESALRNAEPEIFNSDQGAQFTSNDFTSVLIDKGVKISMDGRGRVFDNIFIERLWRSLKYEEVYLHDYESMTEARKGIADYFGFYNRRRLHASLGYATPAEVYNAVHNRHR